jgi:hypothetical protein
MSGRRLPRVRSPQHPGPRLRTVEQEVRAAVLEIEAGRTWEGVQRLRDIVECGPPAYEPPDDCAVDRMRRDTP